MATIDYDNYISPCKDICKLDHEQKYCIGCKRTIAERKNWFKYTREEKLKIMAELENRNW